jgi:asparagine synthase (glutamine-hydrolysing)
MCGICGIVTPGGPSRQAVGLMSDAIRHRGPDDDGFYSDDFATLGHRRLSIIDLGGGHQPITNEDGSLWIVFNGEIYNYRELRDRLVQSHRFATRSDTEVILHLYEERREKCLEELRGMFAFAIWDTRERSLFLARDHLGQKPLFYAHLGDRFLFGSEIKALLAAEPSLREMDARALDEYLALRFISPPRTMFAKVRKLPPGSYLLCKDNRLTVQRYWTPAYQPKLAAREADLLDELEQRVVETVRYHMVSDVPIGAFLSGGLDSSLIVAMMSKLSPEPIKTFSVGVPYADYSELPFARLVAEACGTEHYEETVHPSLIETLPKLVWQLDEPSDPLSVCMYYIAAMARRHVKVVLGGDGGDELFGGYDRYWGATIANYYAWLPRSLRQHVMARLLRTLPDGFWYKSLSHQLRWLNQVSLLEGGRRYASGLSYSYFPVELRRTLYDDGFVRAIDGFDPEGIFASYFDYDNADELVDKMLFTDSMVRLPDHSVMILDRTAMAHGLEARSPFLDHTLVEFVARIPSSLKVRGRHLRYIQTRLAARHVPAAVAGRTKQGFSSALPYMLADEFRRLYEAFLSDSQLVTDGYLKAGPIRGFVAEHLSRRADHGNRLWLLGNAEIWYRMAIKGSSVDEITERFSAAAGT